MTASTRNAFLALAAITMLSVAAWALILKPDVPKSSDASEYIELAENLRTQGVYGFGRPAVPTSYREPGYPSFLAAVFAAAGGVSVGALLVVQALLLIGAGWIVWRLGLKAYPASGIPAAIATVFVAACPILAQYAGLFLSEILQLFLLSLALSFTAAAVERRRLDLALAAGAAWSALIMTRLTWLFFPFIVAAWAIVISRDRAARLRLAAIAFVPLLVCGAWSWRNLAATGAATLSPRSGQNLYMRAVRTDFDPETRAAYWRSTFLGTAFEERRDQTFDYNAASGQDAYGSFDARMAALGDTMARRQTAATEAARKIAAAHPWRYLADGLPEIWKLTSPMSFSGPIIFTFEGRAGSPRFPLLAAALLAARLVQLALIVLAVRGGVLVWRSGAGGKIMAAAVGYHLLLLSFFETVPRLLIPAWPIALFFVAVACYDAWACRPNRSRISTRPTATASSTSG